MLVRHCRQTVSVLSKGYIGTVFQLVSYIPVCGTLNPSETQPITISELCAPVMSVYNKTSDLYAFYDTTGIVLTSPPGTGQTGCLCFALSALNGFQGDFCVWIDGYVRPDIWWAILALRPMYIYGSRVISTRR